MEPLARPGCNTLAKPLRLVNSLGGRLVALFLLAPCAGCMMGDPEPLKTMNEVAIAFGQLADSLESVHDAESARNAIPHLDSGFDRLNGLMLELPAIVRKYKDKKVLKSRADQINADLERAVARLETQTERLEEFDGLPLEFWRVVRVEGVRLAIASFELLAIEGNRLPKEASDFFLHLRELLEEYGHDRVISIELTNLPPATAQQVFDKFKDAAPEAKLYHVSDGNEHSLALGPVDDFTAIVNAVDFGDVVSQDLPRRLLAVEVDRRKLGMRANSDEEERSIQKLDSDKKWQRWEREREEREARDEAERRERELRERKPQPEDPDYHERLAERMLSASHFDQEEIIDALLLIEPSEVKSKDTRKKIARGFKEIAFDGHGSRQEKAIRGLVIWGGKYSVPILLQLLEKSGFFAEEEVYRALGDLKDARAAGPVAARLGDFSDHDEAYQCLRRMGPAAEEALLEVAPSNNAKVSLAAIELLGEVGTKKSNSLLRKAERSRNPHVRAAAKKARERIRRRETVPDQD